MIFFITHRDSGISLNGVMRHFQAASGSIASPESIPADRIYCATVADFVRMKTDAANSRIADSLQVLEDKHVRARPGFPLELGISNKDEFARNLHVSGLRKIEDRSLLNPRPTNLVKQLKHISRSAIRIALFNGLGAGIGDTIVGLTALRQAHKLLADRFQSVKLEAFVDIASPTRLAPVLEQEALIDCMHKLPVPLHKLLEYDAFFDTGGLSHRDDFSSLPMVDFFLKTLGIGYRKVPPRHKRNHIRITTHQQSELTRAMEAARNEGEPLLLFHPTASSRLRSVPDEHLPRIIDALVNTSGYRIITVVPLAHTHARIIDLSNYSQGFLELCSIVAGMDAIITVDTSIYHIADSFSIPTVVWFSSIDPQLRVKYYPCTQGKLLDGARDTGYFNRHIAKSGDDIGAVTRLWADLDIGETLEALSAIKQQRRTLGSGP